VITIQWIFKRATVNLFLAIALCVIGCSHDNDASYRYREIEVEYLNTKDDIKISGTLTVPTSDTPVPAVLLLQGSGPHDRNEMIGRHKIFKVLARHLAQKGIAVLRSDKRGCGKSEGEFIFGDIESFAEDGFAGIEFLRDIDGVDSSSIGIIGHSLGGMIAARMAGSSSDIRFVVSMASTGSWGRDAIWGQNELWARSSGVPEEEFENIKELSYRMYDLLMMDTATIEEEDEFVVIYEELALYLDEDLRAVFYPGQPRKAYHYFRKPGFQKSMQLNPAILWKQVKCPTLIIWGSLDHHVSERSNQLIIEALEKGGNPHCTSVILENHNHHFQLCRTGRPAEVQAIDKDISKEALDTITDWIIPIAAE
jgi:pimeloyl-ACP methyl ester carboxylesterase